MKVTITKGQKFHETEKRVYQLLYKIISEEVKKEQLRKAN